MDFKIVLTLNETARTDRGPITREVDGGLFMVGDGQYAILDCDREALIQDWIEERGVPQHESPLDLISYTVERY